MKNKPKKTKGLYPKVQEMQYQRELVGLINGALSKALKEAKKSYLSIKKQYEREAGIKNDAYADRLQALDKSMRVQVTQSLSTKKLKEVALKRGITVNAKNKEALARQIKSVSTVDIFAGKDKWLKPVMKSFVSENVSLIQNVGAQALKRASTTISMGVQRGWTLKQITKELQKTAKFSQNKAKLIARDQVASLNGQITKIRHKEVGINKYIWSTSLDERVRDSHLDKEGEVFSWNSPPPDTGHPGEDINCRCVAIPAIEI